VREPMEPMLEVERSTATGAGGGREEEDIGEEVENWPIERSLNLRFSLSYS